MSDGRHNANELSRYLNNLFALLLALHACKSDPLAHAEGVPEDARADHGPKAR